MQVNKLQWLRYTLQGRFGSNTWSSGFDGMSAKQATSDVARYAAVVVNSICSKIEGSSFSDLFTRVEIGHIRIGSDGKGVIRSRGHRSSAPSPSFDRHQQTIDVGRHAAGRPLPHRAPHKPPTQVALRAGRSRMLIAVHGLRSGKASEAIEDPLTEVV
jgi:hypothetical protein